MQYKYEPRTEYKYVGSYRPKIDGYDKALGLTRFFDDWTVKSAVPRMLHCSILNAPYANATILSMDTSKAEAMEGVRAIIRYDDPEILAMKPTTHSWTDMAITPYYRETVPKWFDRRVLDRTARFVGDQMGVCVAADTREIADAAIRSIEIQWEAHPTFLTVEGAQEKGAYVLHPEANPSGNQLPHREDLDGCVAVDDIIVDEGDVDQAFAEADLILETDNTYGGFSTQGTLDFRGCMIDWRENKMEVWTNHYNGDQVRIHLGEMLDVPLAKIRVHNTNCGAHMGKWNLGEHEFFLFCAMLSKRTGCPVKYKMNAHEEFAETRTSINYKIKSAVKKDGRITGWYWDATANNGAYTGVTGYALTGFLCAEGLNRLFAPIANMRIRSRVFFTNRIPAGVMRGIGNIQPNFAIGQTIDEIAEALGMDPIEVYKKNFGNPYQPHPNHSVASVLDAGAREIGWQNRHPAGAGPWIEETKKRGLGVSLHNLWHAEWQESGRGRLEVSIRVNPDMSVILNAPTKENGSGANSAIALACAELIRFLGVGLEDITYIYEGDTEMGLRDCPPTDSVCSYLLSEALVDAAEDLKRQYIEHAARFMDVPAEDLIIEDGQIWRQSDPAVRMAAKDLIYQDDCVPITGRNIRDNDKVPTGVGYEAWFAEVEVDTETGKTSVRRMAVAADMGQVMHASGAESQLIGGQLIGMGETLFEEYAYDEKTATALNRNYIDYRIGTTMDFPDVSPLPMEDWKGRGKFGAMGMAETTPTGAPAAIANAIYNAIGIRFHDVPITPKKILNALAKKTMEEAGK